MKRVNPTVLLDSIPAVRFFLLGSAFLTILAYFAADYSREVEHLSYPYNTPFFTSSGFTDLFTFRLRFLHYHHLDFFSLAKSRDTIFSYPPTMGLLYALVYWPGRHIHEFYVLLTVPPAALLFLLLGQQMVRRGAGIVASLVFLAFACLTAYPFWLNYYLGNLEIFIALILALGVLCIVWEKYYLAAFLIGIAGSMKVFPFFLLGILLSRRKYRQLAFGLFVAGANFVWATWMECPSFAVARKGMADGANAMGSALILKWMRLEDGMDHSLFSLFKRIVHKHFESYKGVFILPASYLTAYTVLTALCGLAIYFLYIRKLPLLNQILNLSIAAVLLPPMSHDYTLMHLYLSWGMFVLIAIDAARERRHVPGLLPVFVCFTLLFTPLTEFVWKTSSIDGQVKSVVLVVLWWLGIRYPFAFEWRAHAAGTATDADLSDNGVTGFQLSPAAAVSSAGRIG